MSRLWESTWRRRSKAVAFATVLAAMTATVPSWGRTLRHDSANRLVAVEDGARRTSFRYDAFGALDGVCVSEAGEAPVCTAVLLDTSGSLPVVIGTVRTARDAVLYARGVSGLAAQTAVTNGVPSDVYYGLSDERRSLRALVKAGSIAGAAEVVHRKAYDAYGVLRATEGPFGSAIGFAGEWTTPEGWTWNRARFVIPEIGRLDRRDTFAGYAAVTPSLNRYAYANNDPVNKLDPTGMAATYGADEMLLQAGIGAGDTFVNSFLNMPASTWNLLSWGLSGVNRALGQESVYAPTPNWVGHARVALGTDVAGLEETGGYKAGSIGMTVAMAVRDLYKLGRSLASIRRVGGNASDDAANLTRMVSDRSSNRPPTLNEVGELGQSAKGMTVNPDLYVHDFFVHAQIDTMRSGAMFTEYGEWFVIAADEVIRARQLGVQPNTAQAVERLKTIAKVLEKRAGYTLLPENVANMVASYDRKLHRLAAANGLSAQELARDLAPWVRGSVTGRPIPPHVLDLRVTIRQAEKLPRVQPNDALPPF